MLILELRSSAALARVRCALSFATLVVLVGCTSEPIGKPRASLSVGSVQLALTATSSSGAQYRLRDGAISISGTQTATASTEDDLDAETIVLELRVGGYLALLHDGWRLEKLVDGDWTEVRAVLTSTNPQPFTVQDQETTDVPLTFRAGDDVIEMCHGRVRISLSVDDGDGPDPSGCEEICAEVVTLGCAQQDFCEPVCADLAQVLPPGCEDLAALYNACAAGQPASSYECIFTEVPIVGDCADEFVAAVSCTGSCTDADGDGVCATADCDDTDPAIGAGTPEICGDGIDQDCDGVIDDLCDWTCDPQFFGDGDCDCGCGSIDIDCPSADASECEYCNDPGSCSTAGCPGQIDPDNNAVCL